MDTQLSNVMLTRILHLFKEGGGGYQVLALHALTNCNYSPRVNLTLRKILNPAIQSGEKIRLLEKQIQEEKRKNLQKHS